MPSTGGSSGHRESVKAVLTSHSVVSSVQFKVETTIPLELGTLTLARLLMKFPDCLTKNGYDETKCTKLVDALYECCQAFYDKHGDGATTVSCPKPNLLRLKMEQRRKGIQ